MKNNQKKVNEKKEMNELQLNARHGSLWSGNIQQQQNEVHSAVLRTHTYTA